MPNFNGLWTSRQQMQARGGNTWPSVPGAPTSPVATAGNASASVAFVAPADTGYPAGTIIGYRVTSTPGGFTGTGATSPVTVTGLTNGTAYTFTVAAQNVNGYGPESVASNSVTPVLPNYIEDVFSTYLYTGNGATQTITNGINLSGQGGLVWGKSRSNAYDNFLADSVRGSNKLLYSNNTYAQQTDANVFTAFNSNGFSLGVGGAVSSNTNGATYVSWTFRKQPKFFDIVTYTGNGATGNIINHNLGSTPGCIIFKRTDSTSDWAVYHRSTPSPDDAYVYLNKTDASIGGPPYIVASVGSSSFTLGSNGAGAGNTITNASGATYVAYVFAHNAGGFGLTGNDNVISCGSFSSGSPGSNTTVNLGYEPQWIIFKNIQNGSEGWWMYDTMRGWTGSLGTAGDKYLFANSSAAEGSITNYINVTPTGFVVSGGSFATNQTMIYIAIRRGPMAVPTTGTSVFTPIARAGTGANAVVTGAGFPVDLTWIKDRTSAYGNQDYDRLRGAGVRLGTYGDFGDQIDTTNGLTSFASMDGFSLGPDSTNIGVNRSGDNFINWCFRRAPGFFDVVCYSGSGSSPQVLSHNLTSAPEMMIVKFRDGSTNWYVYHTALGNTKALYLGGTASGTPVTSAVFWNNTSPTSTQFTVGSFPSGVGNYVAYLFATVSGVSKVGSYTGTGATQTIACGFAAGARFVLIKRTDSTGDWYVWDTVRGMVSGTDPSLLLNTTAAEVNANSVYTITTGFQIVSTAAGINASGGTYIFLAIA